MKEKRKSQASILNKIPHTLGMVWIHNNGRFCGVKSVVCNLWWKTLQWSNEAVKTAAALHQTSKITVSLLLYS